MATTLDFSFYGDTQVKRTLEDRAERAEDARPAWEAIADRFQRAERKQFRSEGGYGSGGWSPLSPRYAAWKSRVRPGAPILVFDGDLKRSLTERPFGVEVIEPGFMVIGSDVEHGQYHQHGTPRMPRRRPVELPELERREWVKVMQRFLVTGKAGR